MYLSLKGWGSVILMACLMVLHLPSLNQIVKIHQQNHPIGLWLIAAAPLSIFPIPPNSVDLRSRSPLLPRGTLLQFGGFILRDHPGLL